MSRFVKEIDKKVVDQFMDAKLGRDMVFEINSYL